MTDKIETGEIVDTELHPEDENQALTAKEETMSIDAMDNVIAMAAKMEAFDKAYTTIMNIVMKRTFAGDWVSHSRSKDAVHLRSASLSGAGCDRVATILGINEKNWKEIPKQMSEDGKSYSFRYEADFTWGGLTRHAYGEASTKNKFFGYEDGKWKELTDIREDHVRKAAQRECQKDGIRRLLGLRKIPIMKLKELGFNVDLVHFVNFSSAKDATNGASAAPAAKTESAAAEAPAAKEKKADKPLFETTFTPMGFEHKTTAKGTPYTLFKDQNGNMLSRWGKPEDETIQKILAAVRDGDKQLKVSHETDEKDGKVYRNIKAVLEVYPL